MAQRATRTSGPEAKAYRTTDRVIAMDASTGGTEALLTVLSELPADAPSL